MMPGLKTTTEVTAAQKVLKVQLSRVVGREKSPDYKTEALGGANEVHPVAEAGERKVPKVPALQNSQAMRVLPSDRNIQKGRLKHHKNHIC